ncbi:tyrosine-type recombinase/integrase [Burkholderia mayonis]|uniref:tyrosine-type recombinase/integrase n=1 Tax=Burkholderia mayonis TaxID=1385591 RepID=UPI001CF78241|nr:tyrosine-type recombinase/integrase [Burkholderia mayonis]
MSKVPRRLPVILSAEEVTQFLESIRSVKHRAILMTAYAGGLRISEAIRLKVTDIDSQRMVLRVEQGKGQADGRVRNNEMVTPAPRAKVTLVGCFFGRVHHAGRDAGWNRFG